MMTRLITLTGENTFAISEAVQQLTDAFSAKHGAEGVERVDGENLAPANLPDLLQGATLFAPNRLVIIKNISANKSILEPLANFLPQTADSITLVIVDANLDKRTKLYKFLKKDSNFQEFKNLSHNQLCDWAKKAAAKLGGKLEQNEADFLVQRVAGDQWRLSNEIKKLVNFDPQITKQNIESLVEPSSEGTAFELLDAALANKSQDVTRLIDELKYQEEPHKLFGLLASQIYALAVISAAGQKNADTIAGDTGLHPFVIRKMQPIAKKLGRARVAAIAKDVALADAQLKSSPTDPWDLLRFCLLKITV